ncbi:GntR family transcriptional regulator, partial [bacterium]|nr:GntR family transcriptional regulator [bacterium]
QEQLYFFSKGIELGTGISIIPILIDEIYKEPDIFRERIKSIDLVVTTFFHYDEVKKFLADQKQRVLAIALDPLMETMVNIAHLSNKDKSIGLVCITDKFAQRVFQSIRQAGIKFLSFKFTISHDTNEVKKFLINTDIVITSPGRKKEVEKLISPQIPLIEFVYVPDKGSMSMLKLAILDIKREGGILEKI